MAQDEQILSIVRTCKEMVGIGGIFTYIPLFIICSLFSDDFTGVDCVVDSDCLDISMQYPGMGMMPVCSHGQVGMGDSMMNVGKCAIPSTDEVESAFLQCYIEKMPPSLFDYISRNVLHVPDGLYEKNSTEFYSALLYAASVNDCTNPTNFFDLSMRTKNVWDASTIQCKAQQLGLTQPYNYTYVNELCPPTICLGTSCLQVRLIAVY